jgi:hypothetical protein
MEPPASLKAMRKLRGNRRVESNHDVFGICGYLHSGM